MYRLLIIQFFLIAVSNSIFSAVIKGTVYDSVTGENLVGSDIDSATVVTSKTFGKVFNFIILSDWGRNGKTDEMITSMKPLLEKHNAQFYFCGHDHDFQYLHEKGGKVEYMVTGTGSGTRASSTNEMSVFSKSVPGFTVISLKADSLKVCFVDTTGNIIYRFGRVYR